uniref:Uncharacterized protein n=1 Tax=Sus scrofa TaxID=9823 RepID=A0A480G0Y1_PIG
MSCGVGHRQSSDPKVLWLWCRPAATAPIQPLAQEFPYASGVALPLPERKKEGREGGRKGGREEGRKERRNEGRKERRKERKRKEEKTSKQANKQAYPSKLSIPGCPLGTEFLNLPSSLRPHSYKHHLIMASYCSTIIQCFLCIRR